MIHKPSLRLPLVAALALILVAFSAGPVAAVTVNGEGYYSRFNLGSSNGGLVIVDRVDADSARVRAQFVGLLASKQYFIVGRSISCNGSPSRANRVFRLKTMTDSLGSLWVNRGVVLKEVLVSSIWIGRTTGAGAPQCRASTNFETANVATGDVNGDGAAGIVADDPDNGDASILVEKRPNGNARVSIVVDPQDQSGNTYLFTLANMACGKTPTKTIKLQADGPGYSVHDIHMNQGSLQALRSVRVRNVTEGKFVGCGPLSVLIALLIP